MILFDLKCANEHVFEAWFNNNESYDQQSATHLISCPLCGNSDVHKAPMAPKLLHSAGNTVSTEQGASIDKEQVGPFQVELLNSSSNVPPEVTQILQRLRSELLSNFENVGDNLANEARKMFYGNSEQRNIYGKTTPEEAEKLREEGIDLIQLPIVIDHNS